MSTRCITPFYKKNETIPLPCGKCLPCTKRRASGWSFRLTKEGEISSSSLFVTLTYNTKYVPMVKNGMTLDKQDIQRFIKRLRKIKIKNNGLSANDNSIKYYLAGEYGSNKHRPHYHIILFNSTHQDVIDAWKDPETKEPIGEVHFGDVQEASIGYTLKYISKPKQIPAYEGDRRQPEFSLMSKGLGKNYINGKTIYWHHAQIEERSYLPLKEGKKAPMPRYYKQKIYNSEQAGYLKGVHEKRAELQQTKDKRTTHEKVEADKYQFRKQAHIHSKIQKL